MSIQMVFRSCRKALWLATICCAQAQPSAALQLPAHKSFGEAVGIYHWGGRHTNSVSSGLLSVLDLNSGVARITLTPRMAIDYNVGHTCLNDFRLASVLDQEDLRSAIADPRLKVLIATVYDGTTFSDCTTHSYFHPEFYSQANTARLVDEYSNFVYRLHELFMGTGKKFILSNWEGDNGLYCGSAYGYVTSPVFRQHCDETYARSYAGNQSPEKSVEGMILWMKARYLGVTVGRERARAAGFHDVEVQVAAEISSVHMLRDSGLKSTLYDVLPRAPFDFVSYSAYESLAQPDPGFALKQDLDLIRSLTGSTNIILGEIGFSRSALGGKVVSLTNTITETALEWGVSYVIQWNLYDQDPGSDFGLFDLDGQLTELGTYYKHMFSAAAARCIAGSSAHKTPSRTPVRVDDHPR